MLNQNAVKSKQGRSRDQVPFYTGTDTTPLTADFSRLSAYALDRPCLACGRPRRDCIADLCDGVTEALVKELESIL